jgi:hypothetical protein
MSRRSNRDRAVSDVVSFVLVFALVISSVGLVTAFGLGTLQELQQSERADAAERAFVVLARGIDDVEDGRSPAYRGELEVSGATISVVNGTTVNVNVTGAPFNETHRLGGLQYRTADTSFTYESGGVFRGEPGGTVTVVAPSFDCRDDHATISMVELRSDRSRAVGGSIANVHVWRENATVTFPETRGGTAVTGVTVDTTSPRWRSYFERSDGWTGTGPYTCTASRVFVRRTVLNVEIRG